MTFSSHPKLLATLMGLLESSKTSPTFIRKLLRRFLSLNRNFQEILAFLEVENFLGNICSFEQLFSERSRWMFSTYRRF